jgi:hypothetical protein
MIEEYREDTLEGQPVTLAVTTMMIPRQQETMIPSVITIETNREDMLFTDPVIINPIRHPVKPSSQISITLVIRVVETTLKMNQNVHRVDPIS